MRNAGLPIETLVEYVTMFQKGNSTIKARKELLVEQRNQLAEKINIMQQTLERLDKKIEGYEERVLVVEEDLKKVLS
jgi:DNA-binding transcriptional MerR regulator